MQSFICILQTFKTVQKKAKKVVNISMKQLNPLIESILAANHWTEDQLGKELGDYSPGYFSQLRSREKAQNQPQASKKLFEKLKKLAATLQNTNLQDPKNVILQGTKNYTLQDYIDKIEEMNAFLKDVVKSGLIDLKSSSTSIQKKVEALQQQQMVNAVVMMDSLDRLEESPEGTLAEAADNAEHHLKEIRKEIHKKQVSSK